MAKVVELEYTHILKCGMCGGNRFVIILDTGEFVKNRKVIVVGAVCADCEEGCLSIPNGNGRDKNTG